MDAVGGGRSSATIRRILVIKFGETATSANWKATWRLRLTTFALILIRLAFFARRSEMTIWLRALSDSAG